MKWENIITAALIAVLSVVSGSYVTHSQDMTEQERVLSEQIVSCSEVIQTVIENK